MATPNATPTFADAETFFDDATRFLEGNLWRSVVARRVTGFPTIQAGITAGHYADQALTDVQSILGRAGREIAAATRPLNCPPSL
jgi:hypothetical protein